MICNALAEPKFAIKKGSPIYENVRNISLGKLYHGTQFNIAYYKNTLKYNKLIAGKPSFFKILRFRSGIFVLT